MFSQRQPLVDPLVLRRKDLGENRFTYRVTQVKGRFYRVIPSSWREVFFAQTLIKGESLEVSPDGDGFLIREDSMPSLPQKK